MPVTSPSFLPSQARLPERRRELAEQAGLWFFYAGLVAAGVTLLFFVGLFAYERFLISARDRQREIVSRAEAELDTGEVAELISFAQSLATARELIGQHAYSSNLLRFLEEVTLPSVAYDTFRFSGQDRLVELAGLAASYQSVADELRVLEAHPLVESARFGGLALGPRGVSFRVAINFKPGLLTTFR